MEQKKESVYIRIYSELLPSLLLFGTRFVHIFSLVLLAIVKVLLSFSYSILTIKTIQYTHIHLCTRTHTHTHAYNIFIVVYVL